MKFAHPRSAGAPPLTVTVTWRGAADVAPLLVALALARGGAARLRLQLVSLRSGAADAADDDADDDDAADAAADAAAVVAAWRAWACAAGLAQLEVLHATWPPSPPCSREVLHAAWPPRAVPCLPPPRV